MGSELRGTDQVGISKSIEIGLDIFMEFVENQQIIEKAALSLNLHQEAAHVEEVGTYIS